MQVWDRLHQHFVRASTRHLPQERDGHHVAEDVVQPVVGVIEGKGNRQCDDSRKREATRPWKICGCPNSNQRSSRPCGSLGAPGRIRALRASRRGTIHCR